MVSSTVASSRDVAVRIVENPDWNKRARKMKTLREMCRIILDFCEVFAQERQTLSESSRIKLCNIPFLVTYQLLRSFLTKFY